MRSIIIVFTSLLLLACGQAGPLYLPEQPPADGSVTTEDTNGPEQDESLDDAEERDGSAKDD
jgi:predicted small lipoprotein YifL